MSAPISSAYGMRFHPILRYWKLHDGTDFAAGCGTKIRAAYSGEVVERYYNAGYGNRLMIDHGKVDGKYVTTGYNHAIRYTVRVGEHVRKGEVIGYAGSTGFSTGGATVQDVELMRAAVGRGIGVKASGGIRTHEAAVEMLRAGASRIGASNARIEDDCAVSRVSPTTLFA